MQNKEIMVANKREKILKELLTRADSDHIISHVDDEMQTSVPYIKQYDLCTNFVVAKSSFKCFTTKITFQKCNLYCIFFKLFKTRSQIYC